MYKTKIKTKTETARPRPRPRPLNSIFNFLFYPVYFALPQKRVSGQDHSYKTKTKTKTIASGRVLE